MRDVFDPNGRPITEPRTPAAGATSRRGARRRFVATACLSVAALSLAACTSGNEPGTTGSSGGRPGSPSGSGAPSSPAVIAAATITASPATTTSVNPITPISVDVAHGTLSKITMVNEAGKHVTGAMTHGGSSWHTTEVLGYGKTYTVTAQAKNSAGKVSTKTEKLTTLEPRATTNATMDRMGGYALEHSTYGVAIVPVVHFDTAVHDQAAAQNALSVTSSRKVDGVWSWIDNKDVAYRPKSYWPAHTDVTVRAAVYGVDLGRGHYGASDESEHFTIGRKQVTVADDNSPQVDKVRTYNATGKVLRTMNTSMGQHSGETVDGKYINFYTLDGTYTVLDHENPAIMSSQSYGLPATADHGYGKLSVPYSTKISTDGIYLHEFNSTIGDQDSGQDVSEGCLNLRTADAVWFFDHSIVGDPVVVHGAKGAPEIAPWEGGYWSISWKTWQAGSATT